MNFGQTVAGIARYAAVTAVATLLLYNSSRFIVEKKTTTTALRGESVAQIGSSSGSHVNFDGWGNLSASGVIASRNGRVLSCNSVDSTSTGMLVCGTDAGGSIVDYYVKAGGDVMTGTLVINEHLAVLKTISGASLRAVTGIASSGTLVWNGVASGGVLKAAGGNVLARGNDLQVLRTISGSHLHAVNGISASGSVVAESALSGAYVHAKRCPIEMSVANVTASGTAITTGTGKVVIPIPWSMSGYSLSQFEASVGVKGTTGLQRMSLQNFTKGSRQMLSTNPSIDTGETSTRTAATAHVINTAADDVAGGDRLSFSVVQIHSGTAAKGLDVLLTFTCP